MFTKINLQYTITLKLILISEPVVGLTKLFTADHSTEVKLKTDIKQ